MLGWCDGLGPVAGATVEASSPSCFPGTGPLGWSGVRVLGGSTFDSSVPPFGLTNGPWAFARPAVGRVGYWRLPLLGTGSGDGET